MTTAGRNLLGTSGSASPRWSAMTMSQALKTPGYKRAERGMPQNSAKSFTSGFSAIWRATAALLRPDGFPPNLACGLGRKVA
jgi:hypothetical protein